MTLAQLEALGDSIYGCMAQENADIANTLFDQIKSLPKKDKSYLKLYINSKAIQEKSNCSKIFESIQTSLKQLLQGQDALFTEIRKINEKAFGELTGN